MRRKGLLSRIIPGLGQTGEGKAKQSGKPCIDYPQAGEKVHCGQYAIRISNAEGECHVSVDGGGWQNCRSDGGFCWYDWCPTEPGSHRIAIRSRANGKWTRTETTCEVE